jgi:hypothetical protein
MLVERNQKKIEWRTGEECKYGNDGLLFALKSNEKDYVDSWSDDAYTESVLVGRITAYQGDDSWLD